MSKLSNPISWYIAANLAISVLAAASATAAENVAVEANADKAIQLKQIGRANSTLEIQAPKRKNAENSGKNVSKKMASEKSMENKVDVVKFPNSKGYGFITPDGGGKDVFVHLAKKDSDAPRGVWKAPAGIPASSGQSLPVRILDEPVSAAPFFSGYRPQFYFRTTDVTGSVDLPIGVVKNQAPAFGSALRVHPFEPSETHRHILLARQVGTPYVLRKDK